MTKSLSDIVIGISRKVIRYVILAAPLSLPFEALAQSPSLSSLRLSSGLEMYIENTIESRDITGLEIERSTLLMGNLPGGNIQEGNKVKDDLPIFGYFTHGKRAFLSNVCLRRNNEYFRAVTEGRVLRLEGNAEKYHNAIDIWAPDGPDLKVTSGDKGTKAIYLGFHGENAIVTESVYNEDGKNNGCGNYIKLSPVDDSSKEVLVCHLNVINVETGQVVKRGDFLGYVGRSGDSNGSHVHYDIRVNGSHVRLEEIEFRRF